MFPMMRRFLPLAASALLSACGGHDHGSSSMTHPPPARGQLVGTPTMTGTFSPSDLQSNLTGDPLGKLLLQLTVSLSFTKKNNQFDYRSESKTKKNTTTTAAHKNPSGN